MLQSCKGGDGMSKKGFSQEMLKCIACVAMLIDHVGATLIYTLARDNAAFRSLYEVMRMIGRLSFPIFCFLLVEGAHHTRNSRRYALRLALSAVFSELPYDLALRGGPDWQHQNVMVTLLLGFFMLKAMEKCPGLWQKLLAAVPFLLLGRWIRCDYGMNGIFVILLFELTREEPRKRLLQFFGLWFAFSPSHAMMLGWLDGFRIATQEWALLALVPISLYSGRKVTASRWVQRSFYLFYPLHLLVLYGLGLCIR